MLFGCFVCMTDLLFHPFSSPWCSGLQYPGYRYLAAEVPKPLAGHPPSNHSLPPIPFRLSGAEHEDNLAMWGPADWAAIESWLWL